MLHFNINYQPLTQNKSGEKEKGIWLITHTHTRGRGKRTRKKMRIKYPPFSGQKSESAIPKANTAL